MTTSPGCFDPLPLVFHAPLMMKVGFLDFVRTRSPLIMSDASTIAIRIYHIQLLLTYLCAL
jgi:hypothetical protein